MSLEADLDKVVKYIKRWFKKPNYLKITLMWSKVENDDHNLMSVVSFIISFTRQIQEDQIHQLKVY